MAQLMPLPLTVSCFSKIQIGFTFLVPAHLGSPGKRAVKRLCVCVCVCDDADLEVSDTCVRNFLLSELELRMYYLFIMRQVICLFVYIGKNPQFTAFLDSNLHTRLANITENELGLAFPPVNLPKKFRPDPSTFYLVILVTNRQTDKPTPVKT